MEFISEFNGKFEYSEENIITFKKNILGFDGLNKFILIDLKEYEPFKLLQSLEDSDVGFVVTSPFEFYMNYEFELSNETINNLDIKDQKNVLLVTTVTLHSDPKKITTNLKAPIVINIYNQLGEQIITDNSKYLIKSPLIKE